VTGSLAVRGVRDPDGELRDIFVSEGSVAEVAGPDAEEIQAEGLVALPRLADAHVHLDKTLVGERWFPHRPTDTLRERARMERELLEGRAVAPLAVRAARLLEQLVARGTTLVQSHVDVEDAESVRHVETLLTVAEEHAGLVDVALVAFPQAGVLGTKGSRDALDAAVSLGAEAVGGLDPMGLDGDRDAHLDAVFDLAERHGCRVDVHLHEPTTMGTATMRAIARRAQALGMQGRCAVSHGYALAQVDESELSETAEAMAAAGVSLITSVPGDGRLPPLRRLRELGVNAIVASDNIRDSWSPFGTGDQVARAGLAAYCSNWREDRDLREALPLVSHNPAVALGRPPSRLEPGDPADFTLLPGENLADALVTASSRRIVVRAGTVVAADGRLVHDNAAQGRPTDIRRSELSEA
jgi:cytosine/adenosine deaminase-related metal-dependent hydrolase